MDNWFWGTSFTEQFLELSASLTTEGEMASLQNLICSVSKRVCSRATSHCFLEFIISPAVLRSHRLNHVPIFSWLRQIVRWLPNWMGLLPRLSQQAQAKHPWMKRVMPLLLLIKFIWWPSEIEFVKHLSTYIDVTKRRLALLGAGALATGLLKTSSAFAEGNECFRWSGAVFSRIRLHDILKLSSRPFLVLWFDINWSCSWITEVPENYKSYVDAKDGYSYLYPAEWRVGCHIIPE